jgi:bifunctional UDP-N-acetylglucosamine pyrophosphorylase/glucosamine-1-phosphate N-acetyltransferase
MNCEVIVLAAGFGTRMKSKVPKVLHLLGGKPLVWWGVQTARGLTGKLPYVIVGPNEPRLRELLKDQVHLVEQRERQGTGHAVLQACEALSGKSDLVLVTSADMPLLRQETLEGLVRAQEDHNGPMTLLSAQASKSRGFGRILRDREGRIREIVEEAHASAEELAVNEVNVGAYCFRADWLWENLRKLPLSPKGEYYLTDMVALAVGQGQPVGWAMTSDEDEIIGINTREHLSEAHAALQRRINRAWMNSGVTIIDPTNVYIGPEVRLGMDTVIHPNTHLEGETVIGEGCTLGPNSIIRNTRTGDNCEIFMSVVSGATLEDEVDIGPFARLREGAYLCHGVHMGNFGEVKNSTLGPGVKMGHFSYVGDADIGENSNVSAGVITCNYDGTSKHHTEVGEDVFIGSDTMLVAPLRLGKGSRTGAGSVVTKDVPEDTLVAGVPARAIRKLKESD